MSAETARLIDLGAIELAIWQELPRAAHDRQHAWRTPVLATVACDAHGEWLADARVVVLREVDAGARQFTLYTDARAGKVAQLAAHPQGTLVMWSRPLSWQLRCRVRLSVEDSGLRVSSRWTQIGLSPAAQDYLSPLPPGTPLAAQPPALSQREFFAVVTADVLSIDWLELDPRGHRRARFDADGARWVQP